MVNIRTSSMSPTVQRELLARWDEYRVERNRQEMALEDETAGYKADEKDYFDRGGKPLITLKDWLKGQSGEKRSWENENPATLHDVYTPTPGAWGQDQAPPW